MSRKQVDKLQERRQLFRSEKKKKTYDKMNMIIELVAEEQKRHVSMFDEYAIVNVWQTGWQMIAFRSHFDGINIICDLSTDCRVWNKKTGNQNEH